MTCDSLEAYIDLDSEQLHYSMPPIPASASPIVTKTTCHNLKLPLSNCGIVRSITFYMPPGYTNIHHLMVLQFDDVEHSETPLYVEAHTEYTRDKRHPYTVTVRLLDLCTEVDQELTLDLTLLKRHCANERLNMSNLPCEICHFPAEVRPLEPTHCYVVAQGYTGAYHNLYDKMFCLKDNKYFLCRKPDRKITYTLIHDTSCENFSSISPECRDTRTWVGYSSLTVLEDVTGQFIHAHLYQIDDGNGLVRYAVKFSRNDEGAIPGLSSRTVSVPYRKATLDDIKSSYSDLEYNGVGPAINHATVCSAEDFHVSANVYWVEIDGMYWWEDVKQCQSGFGKEYVEMIQRTFTEMRDDATLRELTLA